MTVVVIYQPTFNGGGAERNGVLLASELAGRGHRVIIAVDADTGPNRKLLRGEVKVRELSGRGHWRDIVALRKLLKESHPQSVLANGGLSPLKFFAASLGVLSWSRVVVMYHSLYEVVNSFGGGLLMFWLSFFVSRAAGATVAVSHGIKQQLITRFFASQSAVRVIYNPIDIKLMNVMADDSKALHVDGPYLLCAARLVSQKNLENLIRAYATLQHDHKLVVIGEGSHRPVLEKLVKDLSLTGKVVLPGYVENPFPLYRDASAFVLPSRFEPFGNALIEAMAFGITCVAVSGSKGPEEITQGGRFGYLAASPEPEDIAAAIHDAILRPLDPGMLIDRASEFSVDLITDRYEALFTASSAA